MLEQLNHGTTIVLARHPIRDREYLLCVIPENDATPFVTWERSIKGHPWHCYTGHYFTKLEDACSDYHFRSGKVKGVKS